MQSSIVRETFEFDLGGKSQPPTGGKPADNTRGQGAGANTGLDAATAPVLEVRNVHKHYRMGSETVRALDGVDLKIMRGEYVAIMGASGSGKSTLLNILGCLDLPTEGSYFLGGEDVARLSQSQLALIRGRRIGFVFQTFELLARATALTNVQLPLVYARTPNRRQRAMDALERVGLTQRAFHKPNELSGGQRQRVAIARALAQEPDILLADEPTGNLDSKTGKEILALFDKLHDEGQTIVLVTHDAHVADRTRRVVRLADGRVVSDGPSNWRPDAAVEGVATAARQQTSASTTSSPVDRGGGPALPRGT